jgi:hypothetical protein
MLGAIQVRRPPFIDWAGWYFPQESKATSDDQLAGILLQLNDSVTPWNSETSRYPRDAEKELPICDISSGPWRRAIFIPLDSILFQRQLLKA